MDIGFTEEQELLRTSARRFRENECPTAFVRQGMAEPAATGSALARSTICTSISSVPGPQRSPLAMRLGIASASPG